MKVKKLLLQLFTGLMLTQSTCILRAVKNESSYTIARVPGAQIPIKMVRQRASTAQCLTECAGPLLMHGLLEYVSPSTSISETLLKHGVLWGCSQGIGLLGNIAHELGHAVVAQCNGHRVDHIGIRYNNATFLHGAYSGYAYIVPPIIATPGKKINKDVFQATKKDASDYLKEINKSHTGTMHYLLAGPLVGIATNMSLFFVAQKLYPSLFQNNLFWGMSLFPLLAQNAMSLNPYIDGMDAHKAMQAYSSIKKNEELQQQLGCFSDDAQVEVDQFYNECTSIARMH